MANVAAYWKAVTGFLKVKKEASKLMEEAKKETADKKPGYLTSEFWLNAAGLLGIAWGAFGGLLPAHYAAGAVVVITTGYTIGRAIVKATPSKSDDAFMDALAAKLKGVIKTEEPVK